MAAERSEPENPPNQHEYVQKNEVWSAGSGQKTSRSVVVGGPDDDSGTSEAPASSVTHTSTKPTAETHTAATKAVCHETVWQSFEAAGLSPDVVQVLSCLWLEGTIHSQIARFMGPTWGPPGDGRTQVGPMFAPWALLSEIRPQWVNHQLKHWKCYNFD